MGKLDQLATELVFYVMSFLGSKDLVALSRTCKRFNEMTLQDLVWQRLCRIDFNLRSLEGWGESATYYNVYTKVLHRYGKCLGLWRNSVLPYGLFIRVKLEQGQICACLCLYPVSRSGSAAHDIHAPLQWFSPLFTVSLKGGKGHVTCPKDCPRSSIRLQMKKDHLEFKCNRCLKSAKSLGQPKMCTAWREETYPPGLHLHSLILYKIRMLTNMTKQGSRLSLYRIPPSVQSSVSPVTLGLYKGTYGGHGIEIINLYMAENGYMLLGSKILGDPNVPAGKVSLHVDLRQPLTLTREEQDLRSVERLRPETLAEPFCFPPGASQPFSLCHEIRARNTEEELPSTCRARYGGKGRIAEVGYQNSTFCRGQLVVFSDSFFGFYWIDLCCFSLYKLVGEDFS